MTYNTYYNELTVCNFYNILFQDKLKEKYLCVFSSVFNSQMLAEPADSKSKVMKELVIINSKHHTRSFLPAQFLPKIFVCLLWKQTNIQNTGEQEL